MKSVVLMVLALFTATVYGVDLNTAAYLQDISVTIRIPSGGQGSGVIKNKDGVSYVITAGHVVSSLRKVRVVVDSATQTTKTIVYFEKALVLKDVIEDGVIVGVITADADVIRYSGPEFGEDIAILKVRKKNFITSSVKFYLGEKLPNVGIDLVHVGSLRGHVGSHSLTTGVVSQHGRSVNQQTLDQTSVTAYPGSSGGGVFLSTTGEYVGMLVRGASGGDNFNLINPIRRITSWAKKNNAYWVLDDSAMTDTKPYPVENYQEAPSLGDKGGSED